MITSAINLIVAQRLARKICPGCREPYRPSPDALRKLQLDSDADQFWRGAGCSACGHTGYSGRVGIFEMLRLTPAVKELIGRQASESEIQAAAVADGTKLLVFDALEKMRQGLTTPEELLRVIRFDVSGTSTPYGLSRILS